VLITVPTPAPPDFAPCTAGQIKGDKATMSFYLPGMFGYNELKSNVECFNSIQAAAQAGYHVGAPPTP
jgi:hypothetical protein